MQKTLDQLVQKLTKTYGDRLVSVVLYGSAAAGDHNGRFSDINIFCILRDVGIGELSDGEPIFRWWRELGNPAPLLMGEAEVRHSTDCFPIEFHDMIERRRVLHGVDLIAELKIDDHYYRAMVEHELRAKLLRVRQRAAGVMFDRDLLLRMLAESVSTFCVLTRHALRLAGAEAKWQKREIVAQAEEKFGVDASAFRTLLDLREGAVKAGSLQPETLLAQYLKGIQGVVDAVNHLEE